MPAHDPALDDAIREIPGRLRLWWNVPPRKEAVNDQASTSNEQANRTCGGIPAHGDAPRIFLLLIEYERAGERLPIGIGAFGGGSHRLSAV